MRIFFLIISLVLCGVYGEGWNPVEYEEYNYNFMEYAKEGIYEELARRHAPFLRFHKTAGTDDFCFPHNATEYYNVRDNEDWSRQCNLDYASIQGGNIPTYWHAQPCGNHLHVAFWSFFGYNQKCDGVSGARDAWWEFLVVKIRDWESSPHLHEVMFGQKQGWYTRIPTQYEIIDEYHPVAYVGRASHGFYHDDGGTNTCCYFQDTRNPGEPDMWMRTWENLVELRKDGNGEEWMTDPGTDHWNGILAPTYRDDWDLCNLEGCKGSFLQACTTSGCAKSDIGDDPF
ncbi:hypothetical protein SK128_013203 [Halocaridina rubra]|uniref:Uncharacterized protein n=1 Tax=Halocaridina rubra TaxID=373956 RepID=A0AAN9ADR0_HALRR